MIALTAGLYEVKRLDDVVLELIAAQASVTKLFLHIDHRSSFSNQGSLNG
jgi:hypothetical protein